MERYKKVIKENKEIYDHIFANAMGNPVIFDASPTNAQMKANTCGKSSTSFFIKFADGVLLKIDGTVVS